MTLPVEHLTRFLATAAKILPERPGGGHGPKPYITISRQAGAGGFSVAEALLEKTKGARPATIFGGWSLFHERLAELVAENPALKVSLRGLAEEEFASGLEDMVSSWIAGLSPQSAVVGHLFKVVRTLAGEGKVIIVGRAGACLTRHIPGGLHLRLVASLPTRVRRIMVRHGLSEKAAARRVADRDRARAALVKTYFHRDIEDPLLYDLVWNTETVSADVIAATSLRAVEAILRHGRGAAAPSVVDRIALPLR
ncbi:MAG: cytidylate kinase-like family protein [Elusimicrobia bacterium]|nr:cytidylate kinase-like family protein [Elusimicrobiota bacterium]